MSELVDDDRPTERDLLARVRNPTVDDGLTVSRLPFRTTDRGPDSGDRPSEAGEHTRATFGEFGDDDEDIAALREAGAVFQSPD